jgi:predicted ATP-dependent protease
MDQRGAVQAVGGTNQKIEGFFDVCRLSGLTGDQGVIIPAANVQHLMLREDILDAVEQRRFHIYAVTGIDDAMELLTGVPAGARDAAGEYPSGSLNHRVLVRLRELGETWRDFSAQDHPGPSKDGNVNLHD